MKSDNKRLMLKLLGFFKVLIVPIGLCTAIYPVRGQDAREISVSKDFLLGKFNYMRHSGFVKVDSRHSDRQVYLRKETYDAFIKMSTAALKDGIKLMILSGTRSFQDQNYKWNSKWQSTEFKAYADPKTKIVRLLRWWSMPGTSRHHWGTEIDLNNMKLAFYKTAEGKKLYDWLNKNAHKYGFHQPFTSGRLTGYQEEKWHWSYVPLSKPYLKKYLQTITNNDLKGFQGSEHARDLNIIKNWVQAVDIACR